MTSLSFLLAALAYDSAAIAQTVPQTFRDWSVVCDNVKTCMAFSTSSQSEGGLAARPRGLRADVNEGWMTIERAAGPSVAAQILLSRPDLSANSLPSQSEIHLVGANGRPVPRGVFAATLGSRGAVEIPASLNVEFLRVARTASHAILVVGAVKRPVFYVSLSGLVASGRNIDARQGRTNTMGALIDVGRIANGRVPVAPSLPVINAVAFTKRSNATPPPIIVRRRMTDCDDAERFDPGSGGIEAFDLGAGRTLWSVPCGAGAYNTWNRFYIQSARNVIDAARFNDIAEKREEEQQGLVNATLDPTKGTITTFSKVRGLGDCGEASTFTWTGTVFEVTNASQMVPCGGILPQFWPSIFQAQVTGPAPLRRWPVKSTTPVSP